MRARIPWKYFLVVMALVLWFGMWLALSFRIPSLKDWALLLLVGFCMIVFLSVHLYQAHNWKKRFADREDLEETEIVNRFYSDSLIPPSLILREWREVAKMLSVPVGKLRPTDRFDTELRPVLRGGLIGDDNLWHLTGRARRRLRKMGVKVDPLGWETIGDYTLYFATLEMSGGARPQT